MKTNRNAYPERRKIIIALGVVTMLVLGVLLLASVKQEQSANVPVQGIYRIYSDDPAIRLYIQEQNTYIKLNADQTIVYNTTINGKPKFYFEGTYTHRNNEISIKWKDGKLPSNLTIEKKGDDQIIKIGSTMYKKEKNGS
jgi:hypothetical protein